MLGLQDHISSLTHDAVILIRDKEVIATFAGWYERFLWDDSLPIKNKHGLIEENVAVIKKELETNNSKNG